VALRRRPASVTRSSPAPGSAHPIPAALRRRIARSLLAWFDRHQRDLPWRRDRDPYRIWVSEVMLQQTQVVTVIPYFERFLAAFPTLPDLAAADEQDVLRLWEGLGYYRRARDLHRAARRLVDECAVRIPDDPEIMTTLPGFGRYTVNAVLSQAFDRRLPILEANSQRVLSRLFGRTDDPRRGEARHWLWQAAEDLLPAKRPGAFNQCPQCAWRGNWGLRKLSPPVLPHHRFPLCGKQRSLSGVRTEFFWPSARSTPADGPDFGNSRAARSRMTKLPKLPPYV
jgi:endonuclease III